MKLLFWTYWNISLMRYSIFDLKKDARLLQRIPLWLPKRILFHIANRLQEEVAKNFNANELKHLGRKEIQKIILHSTITMLQAMYFILTIKPPKEVLIDFMQRYGMAYKGIGDLNRINKDITRLQRKYRDIDFEPEKPAKDDENFERLVTSTEMILGYSINRDIKLWQFRYYFDMATDKARAMEHEAEKLKTKHGNVRH